MDYELNEPTPDYAPAPKRIDGRRWRGTEAVDTHRTLKVYCREDGEEGRASVSQHSPGMVRLYGAVTDCVTGKVIDADPVF